MDEFFGGNEFEDVVDWIERLEIATRVKDYDETIFFKDCSLKFVKQIKKMTFKNINLAIVNWPIIKMAIEQKYGTIDMKYIQVRLDVIKQEPK